MTFVRFSGLAVLALLSLTTTASGQGFGAPSLEISPNVRAEGMGRAWAFLDRTPHAAWGNVGGLALASPGIAAVGSRVQLVPDLADDVIQYNAAAQFTSRIGARKGAVNVNFTRLNYGGEGDSEPYERTLGVAAGIEILNNLGVGIGVKSVKVHWLSFSPGSPISEDTVTPVIDLGARGVFPVHEADNTEIQLTGGVAVHNIGSDVEIFVEPTPLPRELRVAGGVEIRHLPLTRYGLQGVLFEDGHLLALSAGGGVWKFLDPEDHADDDDDLSTGVGAEIKVLNTVSLRVGTFSDQGIDDTTWGLGLSLARFAGVDFANIPQAEELDRVKKWSVWINVPL